MPARARIDLTELEVKALAKALNRVLTWDDIPVDIALLRVQAKVAKAAEKFK